MFFLQIQIHLFFLCKCESKGAKNQKVESVTAAIILKFTSDILQYPEYLHFTIESPAYMDIIILQK